MAVYTYPQSQVIDEVIFRKTGGGVERAYLHAQPNVDGQTLHEVSAVLRAHGWQAIPYSEGGKPMLEVHGFKQESRLLSALQEHHFTTGKGTRVASKEDHLKFTDKVKKRSLFTSGLFYVLGDISFIGYGRKEGSKLDQTAGWAYLGGTLSTLLFGRKDPSDLQIKDISRKMAAYVREQRFEVPPEASLESINNDKHKGLLKTADDFFRRYPSEMMNMFFALAGVCIATAAYKQKVKGVPAPHAVKERIRNTVSSIQKTFPNVAIPRSNIRQFRTQAKQDIAKSLKREGWLDVGLGSMTFASGIFGTLVKERAHDPDAPPKHGLAKIWEWIEERPLTLTGVGYMASTMCHAASTYIAKTGADSERQKAVSLRAAFVITNLLAEFLVAISSKGHGKGVKSDSSVDNTAIALAADLIVKQPAKMQNQLIDYMANFLGRGDTLAMKNEEAHTKLREQVEALRKNPWAVGASAQQALPTPTLSPANKPELPAWQAKVAAQETTTPSPQLSA